MALHLQNSNQTLAPIQSSPSTPDNQTQNNSTVNNSTVNNSSVGIVSSPPPTDDTTQQIKDLNTKIDALTDKINAMNTEQNSIFGLLTKIARVFGF